MVVSELYAKLDNVRSLVTLIKAIHYKPIVVVTFDAYGIRFSVEASKSAQSHATLARQAFREYQWQDDVTNPVPLNQRNRHPASSSSMEGDGDESKGGAGGMVGEGEEGPGYSIQVTVDMNALLDSLMIFGGASGMPFMANAGKATDVDDMRPNTRDVTKNPVSVRLHIRSDSTDLELMLEEGGVIAVCKLVTFEPEPLVDMHSAFLDCPIHSKVIMNSIWLKDAFVELEASSDKLEITVSPEQPYLRLSAAGISGESELDFPKDSDILQTFTCESKMTVIYQMALMQYALKSLSISSKTAVRINSEGFLSMQFMIAISEKPGEVSFVEFLCSPQEDL